MRVCVDTQTVSEVISGWTGIPVGKMVKDEIGSVLDLSQQLGRRVIGQDPALDAIAQRIITSRASLDDPSKPVGVFLLVGPSGVGKTETALALSDLLYGGERNLITINMSEFQEAHTVSTLKGSPPGYVGYGEGGVLTEAVRRRPYSVVLLDEVEKAHPDVLELFYQVFDKGNMEDGEGREIDFKNNVILLTTNACTDTLMKLCADPETIPGPQGLVQALKPELNKIFKPAFLEREAERGDPILPGAGRGTQAHRRTETRQNQASPSGKPRGCASLRRHAGHRSREALYRSGKRCAECRQHPEQHLAARDFTRAPWPHGRRTGARGRDGWDWTRRKVHLHMVERTRRDPQCGR